MEKKNNFVSANKFIDPEAILGQLDMEKNGVVADFGSGSGYFSIPVAEIVEDGTVYSLDVLPSALEAVESKAKIAGISNITVKRVNLENSKGSGLDDGSMDWVIIKDMLFQNKSKDNILQEAHRILKSGGKALIIEWSDRDSSMGPEKELKLSPEELKKIIQSQNFKVESEIDAGDFHYGFVVVK